MGDFSTCNISKQPARRSVATVPAPQRKVGPDAQLETDAAPGRTLEALLGRPTQAKATTVTTATFVVVVVVTTNPF